MNLNGGKQINFQSLLQTLGLIGGLVWFALSQEHRVTVIESALEQQRVTILEVQKNQTMSLENQAKMIDLLTKKSK